MTATPDDWEEMTEEQANEEGIFDCPTCGRLRDASGVTPEEADEWAASRGRRSCGPDQTRVADPRAPVGTFP
jgi:hypothetical protein